VQNLQKIGEQARDELGDDLTQQKGKGLRPYLPRQWINIIRWLRRQI